MVRWMIAAALLGGLTATPTVLAQPSSNSGQRLAVGSKAPEFKPATWLKGSPVREFEPGKVYVVEFWATWCPPCIEAIPHINEIQKQHGKDTLTVIGISTADRSMSANDAENFVRAQGNRMDYTVAFTGDRRIWTDWMTAAGRGGIPSSFVVDGEGKISFIGHPRAGLDKAVEEALKNAESTTDADAGDSVADPAGDEALDPREARRRAQIQARVDEFATQAEALIKEGQEQRAIAVIDRILAVDGERQYAWAGRKLELLTVVSRNDRPVIAWAKRMTEREYEKNPHGLMQLTLAVQRLDKREPKPEIPKELREMAHESLKKASELSKQQDPVVEETLAADLFARGDKMGAAEAQKRAVEATKNDPALKEKRLKVLDAYLKG